MAVARWWWAAVTLGAGLLGAARPAAAQTDPAPPSADAMTEARAHFERAVQLFESGDPRAALAEFERAYALSQRPSLLFNLGATHQALHEYPEAIDALRRFLSATEGQRSRQRGEAERALREMEPLMARVQVTCIPPTAALTVDGRAAAGDVLTVGPGHHVIEATAPERVTQRVEVTLASGDRTSLRLVLPPVEVPAAAPTPTPAVVAPEPAPVVVTPPVAPGLVRPAPRPWWSRWWVWGATGGVFAVGAAVTGVLAVGAHDEFQMLTMESTRVDPIATRGRALAITADVLGVAAVASVVTALVMATRGDAATSTGAAVTVQPRAGGASVAVTGRF